MEINFNNPIQWRGLGEHVMDADCEFFIVVADGNLGKTAHKEKEDTRNRGNAHFALVDEVTKTLHGWCPSAEGIGTIQRTAVDPLQTLRKVTMHVITFKVRLQDNVAQKKYIPAPEDTSLNVTVEDL